jgi:hypothetical protein
MHVGDRVDIENVTSFFWSTGRRQYFGKGGAARRVRGSEFVCGDLTVESVLCVG